MATRNENSMLGETRENVSSTMNGIQDKVADSIDEMGDRISTMEQQLREAGDALMENARKLSEAASKQVQLHPLAAFGIAFLVGVTAAKMMRR